MSEEYARELTLRFKKERWEEIQADMRALGVRDIRKYLNHCLLLSPELVRGILEGKVVALVDEKNQKYKEVVTPQIDHLKKAIEQVKLLKGETK